MSPAEQRFLDELGEIELKYLLSGWMHDGKLGDGGMLNPWVHVQWAEWCEQKDCDDFLHSHAAAEYLRRKGERIVPLFHLAKKVGDKAALKWLREKPGPEPKDSILALLPPKGQKEKA